MTDIMTAVNTAKQYVSQFYPNQDQNKFELEEIQMSDDDKFWLITIGMEDSFSINPFTNILIKENIKPRKYKVVRIDAQTGEVKSMKIREVA